MCRIYQRTTIVSQYTALYHKPVVVWWLSDAGSQWCFNLEGKIEVEFLRYFRVFKCAIKISVHLCGFSYKRAIVRVEKILLLSRAFMCDMQIIICR